jgi:hypothetical protein
MRATNVCGESRAILPVLESIGKGATSFYGPDRRRNHAVFESGMRLNY